MSEDVGTGVEQGVDAALRSVDAAREGAASTDTGAGADKQCSDWGTADKCAAHGCQVVSAYSFAEDKECFARRTSFAGCQVRTGNPCGDTVLPALDPTGGCWLLPSNCLPEGWAESSACELTVQCD
ncbi:MAG: hypothetical protein OXU20_35025 [Myxococcales bacterium]|nr:hypothetical protein [Myxococcales bacterium]